MANIGDSCRARWEVESLYLKSLALESSYSNNQNYYPISMVKCTLADGT